MSVKSVKILPLLAIALLGTSCEETIRDRYSPVESSTPQRTVLVEEYTGQRCINCPNGHQVLEGIEAQYNTLENLEQGVGVIVVGLHIPNWGTSVESGGFITPEAASLTPEGISPPQAQVNRRSGLLNRDQWVKAVDDEISVIPAITFPTSIFAEENNGVITVSGTVTALNNISEATLHIWIVEDNIAARQRMPDGRYNDDYVHNNVYRGAAYGINGRQMSFIRNSAQKFSVTMPVHPSWDITNLRTVVFVETPTEGVINAASNHITRTK